jgi:hypothetical protein
VRPAETFLSKRYVRELTRALSASHKLHNLNLSAVPDGGHSPQLPFHDTPIQFYRYPLRLELQPLQHVGKSAPGIEKVPFAIDRNAILL